MAGLENYPFLTLCGIKKSNLYEFSTAVILGRFSNSAAVTVRWNTMPLQTRE